MKRKNSNDESSAGFALCMLAMLSFFIGIAAVLFGMIFIAAIMGFAGLLLFGLGMAFAAASILQKKE